MKRVLVITKFGARTETKRIRIRMGARKVLAAAGSDDLDSGWKPNLFFFTLCGPIVSDYVMCWPGVY